MVRPSRRGASTPPTSCYVSPHEIPRGLLREFTASDLDGNLIRVFYDFSRDL